MSTEDTFKEMTDLAVAGEAEDLLGKHLDNVRQWKAMLVAEGKPPTLHDLIKKLFAEQNRRGPALTAYAAALWKMLED